MSEADSLVTLPDTDRQYHIDLAPGEVADYILLPVRILVEWEGLTGRRSYELHTVLLNT